MAVIDSKGRLHGKVGNVVYRTVGDMRIVQARPARIRQTLSTKESALEFGLASNAGASCAVCTLPLPVTAMAGCSTA